MLSLWLRLDPIIRQSTRSWTTRRLFSYTRTSLGTPEDGKDTPPNASNAARQAYAREYYQRVIKKRLAEDPAYQAKRLEYMRQYNKDLRERMQQDADFRAKTLQMNREWRMRVYHKNHDFAERKRKAIREHRRLHPKDPESATRHREHMRIASRERLLRDDAGYKKDRFTTWLQSNMPKHKLEWKTHNPCLSTEKVEKHCASCHRLKGLKLWWERKPATTEEIADKEQFDCMLCFFNHAGDNLMPIGFEGLTFDRPTAAKRSTR